MKPVGIGERLDLNAKIFLEHFLRTDDFAFQPGKILFVGLSLSGFSAAKRSTVWPSMSTPASRISAS